MKLLLSITLFCLFTTAPFAQTAARKRLSIFGGINRTARFDRSFRQKQLNASLLFNYGLTGRLSLQFQLIQPLERVFPVYRAGLNWKIY